MPQPDRFYTIPAADKSETVIFVYSGTNLYHLYFEPSSGLPPNVLELESMMLFKIPAHHSASIRITEVEVGAAEKDKGRYLIDMQLYPVATKDLKTHLDQAKADLEKCAKQASERPATLSLNESSSTGGSHDGVCVSENNDCPGTYSPCAFGQVVTKEDGVCACRFE